MRPFQNTLFVQSLRLPRMSGSLYWGQAPPFLAGQCILRSLRYDTVDEGDLIDAIDKIETFLQNSHYRTKKSSQNREL